jgi:Na+/proline symporter
VSDRSVPKGLLFLTSIASFMGAGLMVGIVDLGHSSSIAVGVLGVVFAVGFFFVSTLAPRIRRITGQQDIRTLPQFLEWRYPSKSHRCQRLAGLVNLIAYLMLAALQLVGLSVFLSEISGVSPPAIITGVGLLAVVYTAWAGLRGEFLTDYVQAFFIFFLLLLVVPLLVGAVGGIQPFCHAAVKIELGNPTTVVVLCVLGIVVWAPALLGSMDVWQRVMAAKNERVAGSTMRLVGISILLVFLLFMVVGNVSRSLYPEAGAHPAVKLFLSVFPAGGLLGLALAGLVAAMMSTADTMLLVAGVSLANDLRGGGRSPHAEGTDLVRNRLSVALCGVVAILLALTFQDVIKLVAGAFSSLAILVPTVLGGLLWKRATEQGAFWSIAMGLIVLYSLTTLTAVLSPAAVELVALPAFFVSVITMVAVSKATSK